MIANRNKTLAEIMEKRRKKLRKEKILSSKVFYRDWSYSFGIKPPKKIMPYQLWIKEKP